MVEEVQNKVAVEDRIDQSTLQSSMIEVVLFLIHRLMAIDLLIEEAAVAVMMMTIDDQWITVVDMKEEVKVVQKVASKTVMVVVVATVKESMMVIASIAVKRATLLSIAIFHLLDPEEVTIDTVKTIEKRELSTMFRDKQIPNICIPQKLRY